DGEDGDRPQAEREVVADLRGVAGGRVTGDAGEERGDERDRDERLRQEVEEVRVVPGRVAGGEARTAVRGGRREVGDRDEADLGDEEARERPRRDLARAPQPRSTQPPPWPEAEPGAVERDDEDERLERDAERRGAADDGDPQPAPHGRVLVRTGGAAAED